MTDAPPGPPTDPGSPATLFLVAILPSVLAVVAVSAVITALFVWRGETTAERQSLQASSPSASVSGSATPATPSPTASPTPSETASSQVPPSPTEQTTKPAKRLAVAVLNQTRRTGLARAVAARVRSEGWTVAQVGNFRGNVSVTTVYYPRGARAQAAQLADVLAAPPRTRPAFAGLSSSRLTVVITDNYPRQP